MADRRPGGRGSPHEKQLGKGEKSRSPSPLGEGARRNDSYQDYSHGRGRRSGSGSGEGNSSQRRETSRSSHDQSSLFEDERTRTALDRNKDRWNQRHNPAPKADIEQQRAIEADLTKKAVFRRAGLPENTIMADEDFEQLQMAILQSKGESSE